MSSRRIRARAAGAAALLAANLLTGAGSALAACGDYDGDGSVRAGDALGILRVAVGFATCDAERCDVDGNGSVTASDALTVLKLAVGQAVALGCPAGAPCLTDEEFFFERIWTPILTDCVNCHNAAGIASQTDHVLKFSNEADYLAYNFQVERNLWLGGKGDLLLTKPLGVDHGGGQRLEMTEQSPEHADLAELLERFESPISDCGNAQTDFWDGVGYVGDDDVLRAAALLFAGRLPNDTEQSAVATGGETALRATVRDLMTGPAFERFLMESANDQLLTDKFLNFGPSAFDVLGSDYEYPDLYTRIEQVRAVAGDDAAWEATVKTNRALAQEPLRLIANVVTNERPYTEVLTADYVMVNPWSAVPYQAGVSFIDDDDEDEWREGVNHGYRRPGYPHAGLLNSPMFLGRYPSTATNRNRARARWTYYFFLGVDIEGLAPRPIDPDALADDGNPTMTNPACYVCHQVHDPVAGTFQNYGDRGHNREYDTDSLPWTYKESGLYRRGDLWYRDMRAPGFNDVVMPVSENAASLRWLAGRITTDPRFADGAVEFWFPAVFGGRPLAPPVESSDANYATRLAAWAAQDEVARELAERFRDGDAGTGTHGAYNLKDLLVDMVMTPVFRADSADAADEERSDELAEVGRGRLLTPEQLDRKLVATTGYTWAPLWAPDRHELLESYALFYGGIDSDGITVRATDVNALMSTVVERMADETACPITVADFSRPQGERLLFPYVEPVDTPATADGEDKVRRNIAYLHDRLLGEHVEPDDPEVDRTLALFTEIRMLRVGAHKGTYLPWGPAFCQLDFENGSYVETDPAHTIRSWIAVMVYLLGDYRFIHD